MYRLFLLLSCLALTNCNNDKPATQTVTAGEVAAEPAPPATTAPAAAHKQSSAMRDPDEAKPDLGNAPNETPAPADAEAVIADIRKVYAATEVALKSGTLRRDSFAYSCEQTEGGLTLYEDPTGLQLVIHWRVMGDHAGETERIYFKDEQPVFYFRETSSWQFGGPAQEMEDGSMMSGTIDKIQEERVYLQNGKIVRGLSKSYEIKSWEADVDPDAVPNQENPNPEPPEWTYAQLRRITADDKIDCSEINL